MGIDPDRRPLVDHRSTGVRLPPRQGAPAFPEPLGLKQRGDHGIDWVGCLIAQTRKRNLEAFRHPRISRTDVAISCS